jgi:hypothetical protein
MRDSLHGSGNSRVFADHRDMLFRRIHTIIPCLLLAFAACQANGIDRADTASAAADLTCAPPLRTCFRCNDGTPYCAIRCPECAPQEAPASGAAATLGLACVSAEGASDALAAGH